MKKKCPFCQLDLIKMVCPGCNREWENHYEGQIISKVRKVKFKKKPEIGDHYNDIFDTENNGAMFSQDRKYRYALWRV